MKNILLDCLARCCYMIPKRFAGLSTKIVRDAENWISSCGKQFFALHSEIKIN